MLSAMEQEIHIIVEVIDSDLSWLISLYLQVHD